MIINKLTGTGTFLLAAFLPILTFAQESAAQQTAAAEAGKFVEKFNEFILFPTIMLLIGVGFFVFLWGCFEYFINSTNDQGREKGVKHITYGIIGLVVMTSAYGILSIATATFGLDKQLDCAKDPSGSGCDTVFTIPGGGVGPVVPSDGDGVGPVVPSDDDGVGPVVP
jgi:hypothetical protein